MNGEEIIKKFQNEEDKVTFWCHYLWQFSWCFSDIPAVPADLKDSFRNTAASLLF